MSSTGVAPSVPDPSMPDTEMRPPKVRTRSGATSLFDPAIMRRAVLDAVRKLDPRQMARNPVMFVVEVGSVFTTFLFFRDLSSSDAEANWFAGLITVWLWFTLLFANFAEAVAEGRGKAQADTLRRTRSETVARVQAPDATIAEKPSTALEVGDLSLIHI